MQDPELNHFMVTAAESTSSLHIFHQSLLVCSYKVQQSALLCWFLYHLHQLKAGLTRNGMVPGQCHKGPLRDRIRQCYGQICTIIGLFPTSLSGHPSALVKLLLLSGRVLPAWLAPAARSAEHRLSSTRGGGTVERNCKREESQPALVRKWAERALCLCAQVKRGFYVHLRSRRLDQPAAAP